MGTVEVCPELSEFCAMCFRSLDLTRGRKCTAVWVCVLEPERKKERERREGEREREMVPASQLAVKKLEVGRALFAYYSS